MSGSFSTAATTPITHVASSHTDDRAPEGHIFNRSDWNTNRKGRENAQATAGNGLGIMQATMYKLPREGRKK
jgi:hypothetical protein